MTKEKRYERESGMKMRKAKEKKRKVKSAPHPP
jgi:hypothetical protein